MAKEILQERDCLVLRLAEVIQENQEREAQAVKGYTLQLSVIDKLLETDIDNEERTFLENLKAETEEKISDELNHQQGLLSEYVQLTGIQINPN